MYFKSPFESCAKLARQVCRNRKVYLAEQQRIAEAREALRKTNRTSAAIAREQPR